MASNLRVAEDDSAFTDEISAKPGCSSRPMGRTLRVVRRTWEKEIAHE